MINRVVEYFDLDCGDLRPFSVKVLADVSHSGVTLVSAEALRPLNAPVPLMVDLLPYLTLASRESMKARLRGLHAPASIFDEPDQLASAY